MKRSIQLVKLFCALAAFWGFTVSALYAENVPAVTGDAPVTATEAAPAPTAVVSAPAPAAVATDPDSISLDFKDADISSVLRVLSMKSNVNIVTGPEVKGLVTVRLDNVAWEKALDVILRTYDYVYERDGNIIRVTTRDKMKLEPVETRTFIMNYSKATEIQTAVQDILTERGRIKVSERSNMVVVTDIPTNLYRIAEVIKKIDQKTPQAHIDSKIVNTKAGLAENMGIAWQPSITAKGAIRPTTFPFSAVRDQGTPFGVKEFFPIATGAIGSSVGGVNPSDPRSFPSVLPSSSYSFGTLDFSSFQATLNFLKSYSNTKVVSNPRVTVLNNQTAHIQVGQQIPLPTYERNETTGSMVVSGFSYRDTGVVLNVTPHINSADEILVDLKPEVSNVGADQSFGGGVVAPRFDVTQAQTQLLIQSGQTIAIGGLLTDNVNQTEDKVPYLGDVPLVGKLFRSKRQTAGTGNEKNETIFFVTVTTVDSTGQPVVKTDTGKKESQSVKSEETTAATDAAPALPNAEKKETVETSDKKSAT